MADHLRRFAPVRPLFTTPFESHASHLDRFSPGIRPGRPARPLRGEGATRRKLSARPRRSHYSALGGFLLDLRKTTMMTPPAITATIGIQ